MAQINLLKQKKTSGSFLEFLPRLLVRIMLVVVLAMAGYYGWQFIKVGQISREIFAAQASINQAAADAGQVPNREEVYARQAQLQAFNSIVGNHLYWSGLLPALANITLKDAVYSNLQATKDGSITVSVEVPDLDSIDKFLQVFDLPEFVQNFNNLKLGAFHKQQSGNQTAYGFDAQFNFNQSLLRYNSASTTTP